METLDQPAYKALIVGAETLEYDGFGIKVMRLPGDRIFKTFRRKRMISSQIWAPYALRFKENAEALTKLGIETVTVDSMYSIPHIEKQGVIYQSIPGTTLRDWLHSHSNDEALSKIQEFASFVIQLHNKGIHFRSLHLGNVLVTDNDTFALIDIVDMTFKKAGALSTSQRIRNLHHIARYEKDQKLLTANNQDDSFIKTYLDASELADSAKKKIQEAYNELFTASKK